MNEDQLAVFMVRSAVNMLPDYGKEHGQIAACMALGVLRAFGLERWPGVTDVMMEMARTGDQTRARRRWPAAKKIAVESFAADDPMAREALLVAQGATTLDLIKPRGLEVVSQMLAPVFGSQNAALHHFAVACIDEPFCEYWNHTNDRRWLDMSIYRFTVEHGPVFDAALEILDKMNRPYVRTSLQDALVFDDAVDAFKRWRAGRTSVMEISRAYDDLRKARDRVTSGESMYRPWDPVRMASYYALESAQGLASLAGLKGSRYGVSVSGRPWSVSRSVGEQDENYDAMIDMEIKIMRSNIPCPLPSEAISAARNEDFRKKHQWHVYGEEPSRRRRTRR